MNDIDALIESSSVHPEWRPLVADALAAVDADYLAGLRAEQNWLPGPDRLLTAFRRDLEGLRYLLIGESPYPRPESANGIAFYDAAVGELWSDGGLSKAVNRATSLRNLVKAALIAEGHVAPGADGKLTQAAIAQIDKLDLVRTLDELFANFEARGFLLLNATLVLHPRRKPALEARYWRAFVERLLRSIAAQPRPLPSLVLWGRIAAQIEAMPASAEFPRIEAEHPYNLSFIDNPDMRALFASLELLRRRAA